MMTRMGPVQNGSRDQSPVQGYDVPLEDTMQAMEMEDQRPATASAEEHPQASDAVLKLTSCCLSFFFAGCNDGSLGALIPYILEHYQISTGLVIVMYVAPRAPQRKLTLRLATSPPFQAGFSPPLPILFLPSGSLSA
jgi:hypothetical protein